MTLSEVIEHIKEENHSTLFRNIFEIVQPDLFIITTPNKDFNKFFGLKDDELRKPSHFFEWT